MTTRQVRQKKKIQNDNIFLFCARSQFDWPITQKKEETMEEAPQTKRFYFEG